MKAYLGIGTNIGDRMQNLQDSLDALNLLPMTTVTDVSNVYETDPVGYDNQDDFLNIVAEVETELNADNLLGAALGIESGLGRVRIIKNGPRIIDIDLLLFGDEVRNTKSLILPHPRMMERNFVLKPLLDLDFKCGLVSREKAEELLTDEGVRFYCSKDKLIISK
jgi:2-amino-4-hydroxy-6-hydroxymethyldihydropteridine diphosphokinase